jgi:hypothetical protein
MFQFQLYRQDISKFKWEIYMFIFRCYQKKQTCPVILQQSSLCCIIQCDFTCYLEHFKQMNALALIISEWKGFNSMLKCQADSNPY